MSDVKLTPVCEYEPGTFGVFYDGPEGGQHLSLDLCRGTFALGQEGGADFRKGIPVVAVRAILDAVVARYGLRL